MRRLIGSVSVLVLFHTLGFAQSKPKVSRENQITAISDYFDVYQAQAFVEGREAVIDGKKNAHAKYTLNSVLTAVEMSYTYHMFKKTAQADARFFERSVDVLFPSYLEINTAVEKTAPYTFSPTDMQTYVREFKKDGLWVQFRLQNNLNAFGETYLLEATYTQDVVRGYKSFWNRPKQFVLKIITQRGTLERTITTEKTMSELLAHVPFCRFEGANLQAYQLIESAWNIRAKFSPADVPATLRTSFPRIAKYISPTLLMRSKTLLGVGLVVTGLAAFYFIESAPSDDLGKLIVELNRHCFGANHEAYSPGCVGAWLDTLGAEQDDVIRELYDLMLEMQSWRS